MADIVPICPPQGTPFVDAPKDELEIFNRTWWLFFNNLARSVNSNGNSADGIITHDGIAYDNAILRRNWDKHGEAISVLDFGAVADGVIVTDGAITNGTKTVTSVTARFTSSSRGKLIWIEGAGGAGVDLLSTIVKINSSSSVDIADFASATVSNAEVRFGSDSTEGIQLAFDIATDQGVRVYFPRGIYLTTAALTPYEDLAICGQGYAHIAFEEHIRTVPSQIVGLGNFAIIDYTDSVNALFSFNVEKLTFRGTARTGSKGIHLANIFGCIFRDCTFDHFGDQAIHIEAGIDGTFDNLFGTNNLLVRTRSEMAGGFQIGCSDMMMNACRNTTSVSFPNGVVIGGEYGDGHGAGIMITGGNSHLVNSFAHGSQIGWYFTTTGSITTCVNLRADLNQGPGFVIGPLAGQCQFIGCRSHANSIDSDGAFSGVVIYGNATRFDMTQFTYNAGGSDPINNTQKHGFEIVTPSNNEANQIFDSYFQPNCLSGDEYHNFEATVNTSGSSVTWVSGDIFTEFMEGLAYNFNGSDFVIDTVTSPNATLTTSIGSHTGWVAIGQQFNPIKDSTNLDPTGHMVHRMFGETNIQGHDNVSGLFWRNTSPTGVGADERVWGARAFQNQLFLVETWEDDKAARFNVITLARTGTAVDSVTFENIGDGVKFITTVQIENGEIIEFLATTAKILAGSGSPEGVIAAVGGSLYLDGNGALYVKVSGTGNTGWGRSFTSASGDVIGVPNGGTGRSTLTSGSVLVGNGTGAVTLTAGVNVSSSFTTGVTMSTSTIQYLDWSSNQQSFTGVVSVSTNQESAVFTNGVRTT